MRIFITGATGFLGSYLLPLLSEHQVLCLVRSPACLPKAANIFYVLGDLVDPDKWKIELKKFAPQWCIHLAWNGLPDYSIDRCRINLDASIGLFKILAEVGIERIIVAGSCWEYGNALGTVKEDQFLSGYGVFAATKSALRLILESVMRDFAIEYRWVRIFFAYGPGQRVNSLIPQCHAAYSQGRQPEIHNPHVIQDFIYVNDVAQGIAAITEAEIDSGVFNLGSGIPITVGYIANHVANYFKKPAFFPLLQSEIGFWADTSKTSVVTGWKARTSIDDGIMKTLKALDHKQ